MTVRVGLLIMLQADWLRAVFTESTDSECHVFPPTIGRDDGHLRTLPIQVYNSIHVEGDPIAGHALVNAIYIVVQCFVLMPHHTWATNTG
jgi:hypothetical protein